MSTTLDPMYLLAVASFLFGACSAVEPMRREKAPPAQHERPAPAADASTSERASSPPPAFAEVEEAISRVYGRSVSLYAAVRPRYLTGDLNRDGSEDLAVVVRPASGMIHALNQETANWIVGDPHSVRFPVRGRKRGQDPPKPKRVEIQSGNVLLAVIHGYGRSGWRNPEARQSYLLKNAVGSEMKIRPVRVPARTAGPVDSKKVSNGDVILDTFAGKPGFLYYTGSRYAWAPIGGVRSPD